MCTIVYTDDEVTMKICSDVNKSDCCASKLDKGKQKKEWQKDKIEMWEARAFTNCKDKQFQVNIISGIKFNSSSKTTI